MPGLTCYRRRPAVAAEVPRRLHRSGERRRRRCLLDPQRHGEQAHARATGPGSPTLRSVTSGLSARRARPWPDQTIIAANTARHIGVGIRRLQRPQPVSAHADHLVENAPATSAATPVSAKVCDGTPPPPSPAIREALVTSPSTRPRAPPHPRRESARASPRAPCWIILHRGPAPATCCLTPRSEVRAGRITCARAGGPAGGYVSRRAAPVPAWPWC